MHQRILLAMSDPHLSGARLANGLGEPVPIAMIGNHERQLDPALTGARPNPHPAGGEGAERIGEAPRPEILDLPRRAQHDLAREGRIGAARASGRHLAQIAEIDAMRRIKRAEPLQGAMHVNRAVITRLAQERDDALRLAERVDADEMSPLGKEAQARKELVNLALGVRMAENRQAEGRLRDENVAGDDLEGRASRVASPLVIARDDDARAPRLDDDLRRTEHVTGGNEGHGDTVDLLALAWHRGLSGACEALPAAHRHDFERFACCHDGLMAGAGVIGMGMRDESALDRPHGIDEKPAERREEAAGGRGQEVDGLHATPDRP